MNVDPCIPAGRSRRNSVFHFRADVSELSARFGVKTHVKARREDFSNIERWR